MKFKNFKCKHFLTHCIIAFLFPCYKYVSCTEGKMLNTINATVIMGAVFLVIGVLYSFVLHGDLDITEYLAKRTFQGKNIKPFKAFKEDKKEERAESFNYPLLTSFLLIAVSAVLTIWFY